MCHGSVISPAKVNKHRHSPHNGARALPYLARCPLPSDLGRSSIPAEGSLCRDLHQRASRGSGGLKRSNPGARTLPVEVAGKCRCHACRIGYRWAGPIKQQHRSPRFVFWGKQDSWTGVRCTEDTRGWELDSDAPSRRGMRPHKCPQECKIVHKYVQVSKIIIQHLRAWGTWCALEPPASVKSTLKGLPSPAHSTASHIDCHRTALQGWRESDVEFQDRIIAQKECMWDCKWLRSLI